MSFDKSEYVVTLRGTKNKKINGGTKMKANRFEKLYCKVQELRRLYNEGEKEKAQQSYSKLKETIKNEENGFRIIGRCTKKLETTKICTLILMKLFGTTKSPR